jgi:ribonuclease PH
VLQADGGTRTAAITGAYVALHRALERLVAGAALPRLPLREAVAAVSCGLVAGEALLDLDYAEDSTAAADANYVISASGGLVEVQLTAEEAPITEAQQAELQALAMVGIAELIRLQRAALGAQ